MKIKNIHGRQILDSRGNPTVEVDLELEGGSAGRAAVPSGASTGAHEALELRDEDKEHFEGEGVTKAIENIHNEILPAVKTRDFETVQQLDDVLINLDGTPTKSRLGANAILPVSMAFVVASAQAAERQVYEEIARIHGVSKPELPRPMFNILNGGAHANWTTDIQEYMVIPLREDVKFSEWLEIGTEVFHSLEWILKDKGLSTNVGNEGGFAPELESNKQALDLIIQAIEKAGYTPGMDVGIGLDVAASEFFVANEPGDADDQYKLRAEGRQLTRDEWMAMLKGWMYDYPIISVEDPLSEDAWLSWQEFIEDSGNKLEQVVGDDLLVTNAERINKAIELNACNALLVKLNQIGTVSEALAAMRLAQNAGWHNIVSHRSGETEDTFIAHLAVGTACGQIKTGAPSRGERTAKYNELLRIAELVE